MVFKCQFKGKGMDCEIDKAAVILQARTGSSRLPGKVLAEIAGRPLILFLIERLKRSKLVI